MSTGRTSLGTGCLLVGQVSGQDVCQYDKSQNRMYVGTSLRLQLWVAGVWLGIFLDPVNCVSTPS